MKSDWIRRNWQSIAVGLDTRENINGYSQKVSTLHRYVDCDRARDQASNALRRELQKKSGNVGNSNG